MSAQKTTGPLLVSGASGFIGSHLCAELARCRPDETVVGIDRRPPRPGFAHRHHTADIARPAELRDVAAHDAGVLFHLAAEAEVVVPFAAIPGFVDSNVVGTLKILEAFAPDLVVFASSSAVYGNARARGVTTHWSHVNPLGIYGMSKAMGELILGDWAREMARPVVAFRFGNVIGPGCRGLIPFLVAHARRHPEGDAPAMCRGGGRIVRDYLPVDFLARLLARTPELDWKPGEIRAFNVGSGRALTNGDVGAIVQRTLRARGVPLEIDWSTPIPSAESKSVVLDMKQTIRRFDIPTPTEDEVVATIEATTLACLDAEEAQ